MASAKSFKLDYDAAGDVLYIVHRREVATRGVEDSAEIVWRYAENGDLLSATVVGFRERWNVQRRPLAKKIADHFDIPVAEAYEVVMDAFACP